MPLPFSFAAGVDLPLVAQSSYVGPFQHTNGNLYVVLEDSGGGINMFRSTDGGNSWTAQDTANRPAAGIYSGGSYVFSAAQGSGVLMVGFGSSSGGGLRCAQFSMATNTWAAEIASGAFLTASNHPTGTPAVYTAGPKNTNDFVFVYSGAQERIMGVDYYRVYAERSDGDLNQFFSIGMINTAGGQVHYRPVGALGIGDRVHVFYMGGSSTLYHRCITSTNTLGTEQLIDGSVQSVGHIPVGIPFAKGTEIILPIIDSGGELKVWRATSADAPTWSLQTVTPTTVTDPEIPGSGAADGNTVHVFWADDTTQDIYRDNDGGTGTWGTDTEWKDAVNVDAIHAGKITDAIGIIYRDGGTVKYDAYSLGGGSTPITDDDTGTITAAHASTTAVTTARADSGTITGTGASTLAVDLPSSDSGTITATTASTLTLFLNSADSGTISASESPSVVQYQFPTSSDGGTLAVSEASALQVPVSSADSGTITGVGASTLTADIASVDSGTITGSEASTIVAYLVSVDSGTLVGDGVSTIGSKLFLYWVEFELPDATVPIASNDTLSLTGTEAASVAATLTSADSGTLTATDTDVLSVTTADSGTLTSAEASTLTAAITRSDSGTITAAEAPAVFATVVATDSGTISSTEDPAINTNEESKSSSDSGTLTAATASTLAVTAAATDSGTITAAHASTIDATIASTDSGTIAASESPSVSGSRSAETSDTGAITLIESSAIAVDHATADTGTLAVSAASVISSPVSSTDSGLVASSESAVVTSDASAADTGTITSTEDSTITADVLPSTTLSLSMSAASSISVSVASSDTGVLTAAHANALFAEVVNIDTGAITLVEVAEAEEVVFSGPLRATFTYEDLLDGALEVSATELTATFRSLDLLTATFTYEE